MICPMDDVSPYLLSLPCETIEKVRSDLSDIVELLLCVVLLTGDGEFCLLSYANKYTKEENLASSLIRCRLANGYRDTVSIMAEISAT